MIITTNNYHFSKINSKIICLFVKLITIGLLVGIGLLERQSSDRSFVGDVGWHSQSGIKNDGEHAADQNKEPNYANEISPTEFRWRTLLVKYFH